MRNGGFTDGLFYIDTWIGDDTKDLSKASIGDKGIMHVIEIQQGCTQEQDVTVVGRLPQGASSQTLHLAFKPSGTPEIRWNGTAFSLVNGAIQRLKCEVEVISGPGHERVQCSEVEYYDHQSRQTYQCYQNILLEVSIQIK